MQKRVKKILGILLVISLLVGMSYAIWYMTLKQPISNVVASKCFSISIINEKNEINLEEAYPITDEDGKNLTPYSFTIKNTCSTFLSYKVKIEILKESDLSEEYLDVLLNHEEISKLSNLESVEVSDNDKYKKAYEIASGSLGEEDEEDYTLRIWMDYDTPPISEVMNKSFKSKVTIEASMSNYSPVENGITTLHDAVLTNEYQVTDINTAINKIKNKQTPDFSKTAPVITWQEQVEEKETTVSFTMPDPSDIGSGKDYASNLTDKNVYVAIGESYSLSTKGNFSIANIIYQDPAAIDFTTNDYYLCGANQVYLDANGKMFINRGFTCTTMYKIKTLKSAVKTVYTNNGTEYPAIKYSFTTEKVYTRYELESDKSDKGLYIAEDDYGESYYYRGAVKNNYVKFAGFYWHIIRINGDGSIRLLYLGTEIDNNTVIKNSAFNTKRDKPLYNGYMYGDENGTSLSEINANTNNSTIKEEIDKWYEENLINYSDYLADPGFCNDRNFYSGDGISNEQFTRYNTFSRYSNHTPTLKCENETRDLFTTTESNYGNKALTYPISLITIDELMYAGNVDGTNNSHIYTKANNTYWTLSPMDFDAKYFSVFSFVVSSGGKAYQVGINSSWVGIKPVINLKSTVKISDGNGTMANPFVVKTD